MDIKTQTYKLIDDLKAVCHNYGMGNDGNEYKVITQIFLYKFLNDKFGYEIKQKDERIAKAEKWETAYSEMSEDDRLDLLDSLSPDVPRLYPQHLISFLWNQQAKGDFSLIFDNTMVDIADKNIDIFSTQTTSKKKIPLFEKLTNFVTDDDQRSPFARALVDKLVNFSFEDAFAESYDFFAGVFEYVIKDYNTNGGGVYAEYYTPHAIAVIMARLLVGDRRDLHNIECYDPAAGTGTLLMALAHQIGEDCCTIFAQDRSQKSNKMLKLNLILNGLVSSLDHAIQGDTLTDPFHKSDDGNTLRQFDYVVCNPPFNLDFSETRETLVAMPARFWAGVPNVPPKKKESMAIYTCFLQHVLNSMLPTGKAAIVLPTGFLTAKSSVEGKLLKHIVKEHLVYGVISISMEYINTPMNKIGRVVTGKTPSTAIPEYYGGEIMFITPTELHADFTVKKSDKTITQAGFNSIRSNTIQGTSVMVGCIGWDMGNVALCTETCATNQQINSVTDIKSGYNPLYLYYWLRTKKDYLFSIASVTRTPILSKSTFEEILVPMPRKDRQDAVALQLSSLE